MLEFLGNISEKNKNFIIRKEKLVFFFASVIPVIIGIILTIIAAIKLDLIWLVFLFPLLFFLMIPLFPIKGKTLDLMIPIKIVIDGDTIISEGNNFKNTKNISDVKKIIDFGDYYRIYFKWPKKSYKFLCQKSLLVEGTIKDFEKLFENKIIKK